MSRTIMLMFIWCMIIWQPKIAMGGKKILKEMKKIIPPGNYIVTTTPPIITDKMTYLNGPIINQTMTVHTIFYGTKFTVAQKALYADFLVNVGKSNWWKITTQYNVTDVNKKIAYNVGGIVVGKTQSVGYKYGYILQDLNIQQLINNAIASKIGKGTENEVYLVISDKMVNAKSGLCSIYCAWHSFMPVKIGHIKYAYIGSPSRCPTSCSMLSPDGSNSPNIDFEMDTMLSSVAHELTEIATNPIFTAWKSMPSGRENADMCSWYIGKKLNETVAGKNVIYNEIVGTKKYLIQTNYALLPTPRCANGII